MFHTVVEIAVATNVEIATPRAKYIFETDLSILSLTTLSNADSDAATDRTALLYIRLSLSKLNAHPQKAPKVRMIE